MRRLPTPPNITISDAVSLIVTLAIFGVLLVAAFVSGIDAGGVWFRITAFVALAVLCYLYQLFQIKLPKVLAAATLIAGVCGIWAGVNEYAKSFDLAREQTREGDNIQKQINDLQIPPKVIQDH